MPSTLTLQEQAKDALATVAAQMRMAGRNAGVDLTIASTVDAHPALKPE